MFHNKDLLAEEVEQRRRKKWCSAEKCFIVVKSSFWSVECQEAHGNICGAQKRFTDGSNITRGKHGNTEAQMGA